MKKFICVLSIVLCAGIIMGACFCSCQKSANIDYKKINGYQEYISDCKSGYDDVNYYDCDESIELSEKALEYYKSNNRVCGDFIITDYKDGVCINRFMGGGDKYEITINVPDVLDGKKVVKIGAYPRDENVKDISKIYLNGAFAGCHQCKVVLPSSLKYIGYYSFLDYTGIVSDEEKKNRAIISEIEVDKNNKYYYSDNGVLYSKDKKSLLYDSALSWHGDWNDDYVVPEYVETFEPSNGVYGYLHGITIGKNVKTINTYMDKDEDGIEPNPDVIPDIVIKGYKGTVAEKWAKEQYAKFKALD